MKKDLGIQIEKSIASVLEEFEIPFEMMQRMSHFEAYRPDIMISYPGGRVAIDIKYNSRPIVELAHEERWPDEKSKISHIKSWLNEEYRHIYHSVYFEAVEFVLIINRILSDESLKKLRLFPIPIYLIQVDDDIDENEKQIGYNYGIALVKWLFRKGGRTKNFSDFRSMTKIGVKQISVPEKERHPTSVNLQLIKKSVHSSLGDLKENKKRLRGFYQEFISLKGCMEDKAYNLLRDELEEFNKEVESTHYTTAALRIGRAIEHIIYHIAKSLEVSINKPTLNAIKEFRKNLTGFENSLLEYSSADIEEKEQKKEKIIKDGKKLSDRFSKTVEKAIDEIDQNHDIDDKGLRVHTNSILGDMRKKFRQDKRIKDHIHSLINFSDSPLKKVISVRNRAAHADISGEKREVKQQEIGSLQKDFIEVIAILVDIVLLARKNANKKNR